MKSRAELLARVLELEGERDAYLRYCADCERERDEARNEVDAMVERMEQWKWLRA